MAFQVSTLVENHILEERLHQDQKQPLEEE